MAILRRSKGGAAQLLRQGLSESRMTAIAVRQRAQEGGIETIPLDIENLIRLFGILVIREPMSDDISGYLERRGNEWVIGVNSLQHPRRQRFTLAHELAHYLLHRTEKSVFIDKTLLRIDSRLDPMEREADRFAGNLLMPEEEFRRVVTQGQRKVSELSDFFQTSAMAIRYRAKELGFLGTGL